MKTIAMPERPKQGGYAILEHMGGLLFYLTMGAAVAIILTSMFSDSKLSEMQQGLTSIRLKASQVFTGSSSYNGLNDAFAIKAGIVPVKMVRGQNLVSPWGGEVTISANGNAAAFAITVNNVPEKACVGLSTYQAETWESITVNGSAVSRDSEITAASASCSGDANTLIFTSR